VSSERSTAAPLKRGEMQSAAMRDAARCTKVIRNCTQQKFFVRQRRKEETNCMSPHNILDFDRPKGV
jgi:hypothetical protein